MTMEERDRQIKEEGREEGRQEGRQMGQQEGRWLSLISLVCRKLKRNKSLEAIAAELEEDPAVIRQICDVAAAFAPDYDEPAILSVISENS
ncbi:MAG: hypothetical protein LUC98_07770 [Lachnospiraceae bacterium]|nr:hypothetical protein [Lachnospiraceae bacterium]